MPGQDVKSRIVEVKGRKHFLELVKSKKCVVDFYATWCKPCSRLLSNMDKVLDAHKDIIVAKVNVNEYDNIADEFNVTSIPHLVFFKKGKLQKDYINTSDHEALIAHLDEIFTGDTMSSASNKDTDSLEENNTEEANDDSGTKDDNKKVDESDTKDNE